MADTDNNMLMTAVKGGKVECVQRRLANDEPLLADDSWFDYNLLVAALERGHKDIAEMILQKGCRVERPQKGMDNHSPLYFAILLEDPELVQTLLIMGASMYTSKDLKSDTPLALAIKQDLFEITEQLLVSYGLDKAETSCLSEWAGFTKLHLAVVFSRIEMVEKLLSEEGNDVNTKMAKDFTPLHLACTHNFKSLRLALLECQEPNQASFLREEWDRKSSALVEIVKILLSHGANVNARDVFGRPPILLAFGNADIATKIKEEATRVEWKPFDNVVEDLLDKQRKIVETLMNWGAEVDTHDELNMAPLHHATMLAEVFTCFELDWLLKWGCNVDIRDNQGRTPLHYTFSGDGNVQLIETLLRFGADINLEANNGFTAMCWMTRIPFESLFAEKERIIHEHMIKLLALVFPVSDKVKASYVEMRQRYRNHGRLYGDSPDNDDEKNKDDDVKDKLKDNDDIEKGAKETSKDNDDSEKEVKDTSEDDDGSEKEVKDTSKDNDGSEKEVMDTSKDDDDSDDSYDDHYNVSWKAYNWYENEMFIECRKELDRMKTFRINRVSLYDIIHKSDDEMASLIEDNIFERVLVSNFSKKNYPMYDYLLQLQFLRGRVRAHLLEAKTRRRERRTTDASYLSLESIRVE